MISQISLHFDNAIHGAVVRCAAEASHLYNGMLYNRSGTCVEVEIYRRPENVCPDSKFVKDVLKFIRKVK